MRGGLITAKFDGNFAYPPPLIKLQIYGANSGASQF